MNKGYIFLGSAIIISILLTLSLLIVLAVNLSKIESVVSDSNITGSLNQMNIAMKNLENTINKDIKDTNRLLNLIIIELRKRNNNNTFIP